MALITSKSNPQIKFIKDLRRKKTRDATGLLYVEGIRPVGEAFDCGWVIEELVAAPDLLRSDYALKLFEKVTKSGVRIVETSVEVFESISEKEGPQGIAAVVKKKISTIENVSEESGVWVGLEAIQDPGNLGTIMRTAEASGVKGLILLENCADPFGVEAVRASMGALFSTDIIFSTNSAFSSYVEKKNIPVIGTSDKAEIFFRDMVYPKNLVLLMGSEQKGLSEDLKKSCDNIVAIPMSGRSDSLNLAVATGIILYEIYHQHLGSFGKDVIKK